MRERSTPTLVVEAGIRNVPDLILQRASAAPGHVAYCVHRGDTWVPVTTAEFVDEVKAVAKGLIAAGIEPGDAVAVMSATRYEWTVTDFAVLFAGAVVVPIYETNSKHQAQFVLKDSGSVAAFAESARHRALLAEAAAAEGIAFKGLWRFTPANDMDALKQAGRDVPDAELDRRRQLAGPDDVASLVYTSGTVTDPRGAIITHGNLAHLCQQIQALLHEVLNEKASTVLLLPLAHILARFIQLALFASGTRTSHVRDASRIAAVLGQNQPTVLVVVPRVLAKVLEGVRRSANEKKLGKVFERAEQVAIDYGRFLEDRDSGRVQSASPVLRAQRALFDKLFYSKIRATLGGKLDYVVSGAAPLDTRLSHFFRGVGVTVLEGYGLTETTAPLSVNLPHKVASGSVGWPIPGTTIRLTDEGEITAKGIGVFGGYHRDKGRDFDADGWFATGDLGEFDDSGRLRITGRAKDLIITDSGKNISPQKWQGIVERNPLVAHAVVVGDQRPHAAAMIFLDSAGVTDWARANNRPDLEKRWDALPPVPGEVVTDAGLVAAIEASVAEANAEVSRAESVRKHVVVAADLSEAAGYTTPTLKLKRSKVVADLQARVEALYR